MDHNFCVKKHDNGLKPKGVSKKGTVTIAKSFNFQECVVYTVVLSVPHDYSLCLHVRNNYDKTARNRLQLSSNTKIEAGSSI